jgi:hypothetical protein
MEADMWWTRKKKEPEVDWRQQAFDKLIAFRKCGETFTYLGVTMMVTGHWRFGYTEHYHCLMCDYVDARGVLHSVSFNPRELETLERENNTANIAVRVK